MGKSIRQNVFIDKNHSSIDKTHDFITSNLAFFVEDLFVVDPSLVKALEQQKHQAEDKMMALEQEGPLSWPGPDQLLNFWVFRGRLIVTRDTRRGKLPDLEHQLFSFSEVTPQNRA